MTTVLGAADRLYRLRMGAMARQNAIKISKRTVDALIVETSNAVYLDQELSGFGVPVNATGRKVYVVVQTRLPTSSLRPVTIGRNVKMTAEAACQHGARKRGRGAARCRG